MHHCGRGGSCTLHQSVRTGGTPPTTFISVVNYFPLYLCLSAGRAEHSLTSLPCLLSRSADLSAGLIITADSVEKIDLYSLNADQATSLPLQYKIKKGE